MFIKAGCESIIVVTPPVGSWAADLDDIARVSFVDGGDTRRESVLNALRKVKSERVVITDAARPLATADMAKRTVSELNDHDGAIVAVPVTDTLKRVDDHIVRATADRSGLYRAQTPQAFRTAVLLRAHEQAHADGFEPTDDASLLERYGGSVSIVPGAETNIKVTYDHDFATAEALLSTR
jgi:2-C-methyl-D-erythritol 4-phosphate cytidylyltransferase